MMVKKFLVHGLWIWNFIIQVTSACNNLQTCYQCGVQCVGTELLGLNQTECISYIDHSTTFVVEYHPSETKCILGTCAGIDYRHPYSNNDVRAFRYTCSTECLTFSFKETMFKKIENATSSMISVPRDECIAMCFDMEQCYMWDHNYTTCFFYPCGTSLSCSTAFTLDIKHKMFTRTCLESCDDPLAPTNGNVTYMDTVEGSTALFYCDEGFIEVTGSNNQTCLANGTWSLPEPVCESNETTTSTTTTITTTTIETTTSTTLPPSTTSSTTSSTTTEATSTTTTLPSTTSKAIVIGTTTTAATTSPLTTTTETTTTTTLPPQTTTKAHVPTTTTATILSAATTTTTEHTTTTDSSITTSSTNSLTSLSTTTRDMTSSTTSTSTSQITSMGVNSVTSPKTAAKIYIMPCICYQNKTFTNKTNKEIIEILINDTKINTKNTSQAKNKLVSKEDNRPTSKVIGYVGLCFLIIAFCCIILSDACILVTKLKGRVDQYSPHTD